MNQVTNFLADNTSRSGIHSEINQSVYDIKEKSNFSYMKAIIPQVWEELAIGQFPIIDKSLTSSCPNSPFINNKISNRSRQSKLMSKGIASMSKNDNLSIRMNKDDKSNPFGLSEWFSMNREQKNIFESNSLYPVFQRKNIILNKNARKTPIIMNLPVSSSISHISQSRDTN